MTRTQRTGVITLVLLVLVTLFLFFRPGSQPTPNPTNDASPSSPDTPSTSGPVGLAPDRPDEPESSAPENEAVAGRPEETTHFEPGRDPVNRPRTDDDGMASSNRRDDPPGSAATEKDELGLPETLLVQIAAPPQIAVSAHVGVFTEDGTPIASKRKKLRGKKPHKLLQDPGGTWTYTLTLKVPAFEHRGEMWIVTVDLDGRDRSKNRIYRTGLNSLQVPVERGPGLTVQVPTVEGERRTSVEIEIVGGGSYSVMRESPRGAKYINKRPFRDRTIIPEPVHVESVSVKLLAAGRVALTLPWNELRSGEYVLEPGCEIVGTIECDAIVGEALSLRIVHEGGEAFVGMGLSLRGVFRSAPVPPGPGRLQLRLREEVLWETPLTLTAGELDVTRYLPRPDTLVRTIRIETTAPDTWAPTRHHARIILERPVLTNRFSEDGVVHVVVRKDEARVAPFHIYGANFHPLDVDLSHDDIQVDFVSREVFPEPPPK